MYVPIRLLTSIEVSASGIVSIRCVGWAEGYSWVQRYCRIWVLPEDGEELSRIGRPSWIEGTIWAKAVAADLVETWMKDSTGPSVVLDRHSLSPRRIDRLQRFVEDIVAAEVLSTIGAMA
jgi:hypothetical protein